MKIMVNKNEVTIFIKFRIMVNRNKVIKFLWKRSPSFFIEFFFFLLLPNLISYKILFIFIMSSPFYWLINSGFYVNCRRLKCWSGPKKYLNANEHCHFFVTQCQDTDLRPSNILFIHFMMEYYHGDHKWFRTIHIINPPSYSILNKPVFYYKPVWYYKSGNKPVFYYKSEELW
jgi:hypothetical protein